jgi:hypothetical protein
LRQKNQLKPIPSTSITKKMTQKPRALCTSGSLHSILALPAVSLPAHAGVHDDGGMPHAPACDYCLLAARLLPLLGVLLLVLPWLRPRAPLATPRPPVVDTCSWRAHAARGPPLRS